MDMLGFSVNHARFGLRLPAQPRQPPVPNGPSTYRSLGPCTTRHVERDVLQRQGLASWVVSSVGTLPGCDDVAYVDMASGVGMSNGAGGVTGAQHGKTGGVSLEALTPVVVVCNAPSERIRIDLERHCFLERREVLA